MPKYATFPLLIDSSVFLSITKLKKTGYLEPFSCKSGVITWYRKEQPIMSASFMVDTVEFPSYIKVSNQAFITTFITFKLFATPI